MHYLDFHVHTTFSDGMLAPEAVVQNAERCGIDRLAITDHNYALDVAALQQNHPAVSLTPGSEISCIYRDSVGIPHEVHVVALGFDPKHPAMLQLFSRNQFDRRPYIEAILQRLEACGIFIGTYEALVRDYPESRHVGRSQIARKMHRLGYVDSAEAAFEEYIGDFGQRRAYVQHSLDYVPLETCVEAIRSAQGVAVLAHLFYYRLSPAENETLVRHFQSLARERGGMETAYCRYSENQRAYLRALADRYHLMHSAGSDFHGKDPSETMDCRFPCTDFQPLLAFLAEHTFSGTQAAV